MIGMETVAKFAAAIIAFAFLGFVLARYIGAGMMAYGGALNGTAAQPSGSYLVGISCVIFACSLSELLGIGCAIGTLVSAFLFKGGEVVILRCLALSIWIFSLPFTRGLVRLFAIGCIVFALVLYRSLWISRTYSALSLYQLFLVHSVKFAAVMADTHLALRFKSTFVSGLTREMLSRGGLPFLTFGALFERYRFWGMIIHVISSMKATGRPGAFVAPPGIFIGFTPVIIRQTGVFT